MPKQLTESQINALYTFTQSTGVEYYDLQSELVDHLANDIEEQWAFNQNPDFESAVAAAYTKFDKTGFDTVVRQRKRMLGKRYTRLITKCFIGFFTPPKIVLTIGLFFVWYYVMQYDNSFFGALFITIQLFSVIRLLMLRNSEKIKSKLSGKRWLLEALIYNTPTAAGFMGISFQVGLHALRNNMPEYYFVLLPALATLFTLHNYIVLYAIPAKAKHYLNETYPEYGIA